LAGQKYKPLVVAVIYTQATGEAKEVTEHNVPVINNRIVVIISSAV
jgi:hypothetical protein